MITGIHTIHKPTSSKVVLPFYAYAALSLLVSTLLLCNSPEAFTGHHFNPRTLAITHAMALGWGTMMILGASHQLVPVLTESPLYSHKLAGVSFYLAAIGIPLIVYGFFAFDLGWPAQTGGILVNASIAVYVFNLVSGINNSKKENIHAIFMLTAALWLFATTIIGLLLLFNFTSPILPKDSLHYLSLHAHLGIVGWFLLLVIGVASRLLPMFLISKYTNNRLLWIIFGAINSALMSFVFIHLNDMNNVYFFIPGIALALSLASFAYYCLMAFIQRIRKAVDEPMKISLLSVLMMLLPVLFLLFLPFLLASGETPNRIIMAYGFSIFFGWLTAIIFGMTFKTVPFIVWNKFYHSRSGMGKTPNPKDLFSLSLFNGMGILYLIGFVGFITGILLINTILIRISAISLLLAAVLYNWNVFHLLFHNPNRGKHAI